MYWTYENSWFFLNNLSSMLNCSGKSRVLFCELVMNKKRVVFLFLFLILMCEGFSQMADLTQSHLHCVIVGFWDVLLAMKHGLFFMPWQLFTFSSVCWICLFPSLFWRSTHVSVKSCIWQPPTSLGRLSYFLFMVFLSFSCVIFHFLWLWCVYTMLGS